MKHTCYTKHKTSKHPPTLPSILLKEPVDEMGRKCLEDRWVEVYDVVYSYHGVRQ